MKCRLLSTSCKIVMVWLLLVLLFFSQFLHIQNILFTLWCLSHMLFSQSCRSDQPPLFLLFLLIEVIRRDRRQFIQAIPERFLSFIHVQITEDIKLNQPMAYPEEYCSPVEFSGYIIAGWNGYMEQEMYGTVLWETKLQILHLHPIGMFFAKI